MVTREDAHDGKNPEEKYTVDFFDTRSDEINAQLEPFIAEWKNKPGNLIMVLHKIQEIYHYIPLNVAVRVAKELDVHLAKIYGVLTFYHLFRLTPPGTYKISVCTGTACYLKGGYDLIEEIKSILSIDIGHTTEDGIFTLETVRCLGCCGLSPVLMIGKDIYGKVTKSQIPEILAKYSGHKAAV